MGNRPGVLARRRFLAAATAAVVTIAASVTRLNAAPSGVSSPPASLVQYPLPTRMAQPAGLAVGPDGNLWTAYGNQGPAGLARITPAGVITEFPYSSLTFPRLTAGPDGNLWVLDLNRPAVEQVSTAGALLASYSIPVNGSLGDIIAGPDGNIWFTAVNLGQISRVTPSGQITAYTSPFGRGGTLDLAAGPDGNVWYTNPFGNTIGRVTPSGVITEFPTPKITTPDGPNHITAGSDGNLWYTKFNGRIGRITTAGVVTEFVLPNGVEADDITAGSDGNLWFRADNTRQIGQITPSGAIGFFSVDHLGFGGAITSGPDGRIWYTVVDAAAVAAFEPFPLTATGPQVNDLSPRWSPAGGGTTVVITGNNVGTATKVLFGSTTASFRVLGPGQVEATAPPHNAGKVDVTVVTPAAKTQTSDLARFFYSSPACGQVITQSTTLKADIGPCYQDGVVVGADGITLDLGGHRIFNFTGPSDGSAAGVRLPNRSGVAVRHGTISGFDAGVVVRGGGGNVLTSLTVMDNIGPDDIPNNEFGDGIFIEDSSANRVVGNTVTHNGVYDGIGIFGPDADGNVITDNVVQDTVGPEEHGPAGDGIISNGATGEGLPTSIEGGVIERNLVRRNAAGGIANVNTVNGRVTDNTVVNNGLTNSFGNGIGVSVGGNWANGPTAMLIQGNTVHGNGVDGVRIGNAIGFASGNPTGNRIIGNDASGNNSNPKVDAYELSRPGFDLHDRNAGCADNVWSGNTWGPAGYAPPCTATGGSGPAVAAGVDSPDGVASLLVWAQAMSHGRR